MKQTIMKEISKYIPGLGLDFAFMLGCVEGGLSTLFFGPLASGKTTLVRCVHEIERSRLPVLETQGISALALKRELVKSHEKELCVLYDGFWPNSHDPKMMTALVSTVNQIVTKGTINNIEVKNFSFIATAHPLVLKTIIEKKRWSNRAFWPQISSAFLRYYQLPDNRLKHFDRANVVEKISNVIKFKEPLQENECPIDKELNEAIEKKVNPKNADIIARRFIKGLSCFLNVREIEEIAPKIAKRLSFEDVIFERETLVGRIKVNYHDYETIWAMQAGYINNLEELKQYWKLTDLTGAKQHLESLKKKHLVEEKENKLIPSPHLGLDAKAA